MKNLVKRLQFSTEEPNNIKQLLKFKVRLTASMATLETFRLLLPEFDINTDDNEFEACIDCFTDYFNATKEALHQEGVDEVTRYFWIDEE